MATSKDAKIQIELSQNFTDFEAMTDSGDNQIFTSSASIWSGKSGYEPVVRPDGVVSGRNLITPFAGANDKISYAAFTAYIQGVLHTISSGTVSSLARPVTTDTHRKISIILSADGNVTALSGVDHTAFSTTRGAIGGPPLIPADAIELGQVWLDQIASAVIAADEIHQNGNYTERYDYPVWEVDNTGRGTKAATSAQTNAFVKFASALPDIHDTDGYGSVGPKNVYISTYEPEFSDLARTKDFVPVRESVSVSSTTIYGGTVAGTSRSINTGSFVAMLDDGVNDAIVRESGEVLTVKFFPDENKSAYILTQAACSLAQTFPADNQNQAAVTMAAEKESANFTG